METDAAGAIAAGAGAAGAAAANFAAAGTVAADRIVTVAVNAAAAGPDSEQAPGHMMQGLKLRDQDGTVLPVTHLWKAYHSSQNPLVEQLTQPMHLSAGRR